MTAGGTAGRAPLVVDARGQLQRIGMSHRAAWVHARRIAWCDRALDSLGAGAARWSAWVPGRVELLGKHVDYAGGRSLLCDIERGFAVRAAARTDRAVRVLDVVRRLRFETTLDASAPTGSGSVVPPGSWENYVATLLRRLVRDFGIARGVDIAFANDLPVAAGLSSSSALVVAAFLSLAAANELDSEPAFQSYVPGRESLAAYLGAVENGEPFGGLGGDAGVGTLGGSQDQTAILCCEAGRISRYAFAPVRWEGVVPFPVAHVLAIATSGVAAEKTGAAMDAYNAASLAVRRIVALWRRDTGRADATLAAAVATGPDAPDRLRAIADREDAARAEGPVLRDRLEQFLAESTEIVPAAFDALAHGALARFGALVDESQQLAEEKLRNQVPETVALQRIARNCGAVAASAFGAGFGGSVWAMVPRVGAREFVDTWGAQYRAAFPPHAAASEFFLSAAGPAASWS